MASNYDIQGIIQYLQGLDDIIPEKYDGSYELVRETIKAYSTLNDYSNVDFRDLNLVYLMAVGTWKHSVDKKKETVNLSHLPDSEKTKLIHVLDDVWAKAVAHEYEHSESASKDASIGMFGTGFYSFQNKTTPSCSKDFIKMCVDIEPMNDTDAIFDRAEQVLSRDFRGMAAASASVVLHCLKPTVFPILNGNMGIDTIFDAVGLKLRKKSSVGNYISNARIIREFRDKNVDFKNYRVFDYASRVLDDYKEKVEYHIDIDKLKKELELYKHDFLRINEEETYKWRAIKCFQDNFNIEAEDFPAMLERSLEKSYNLLARNMYFAKGAIIEIAHYNPEYTREMFRNLFNEEEPVLNRIKQFEEDAEIYFQLHEGDAKARNHYQDVKASSVYLFFNYPEKYYIYLSTKFENAAKQIGYENLPKNGSMERVQAYFDMADQIYEYIQADKELLQLNQSRLSEDCYEDTTNHVLAEDIVYFLNRRYKEENTPEDEPVLADYTPSIEEYDPGLKAEQYQEIFENPSKITKTQLDTIYYIYLMGGEATCKQVASKYGYSFSRYISHAVTVAKKIEQETGCPVNQREDGSYQYWSILFFGKDAGGGEGTFIWKLRKPVEEAIKAMIEKGFFENMENRAEYPKNIILYGPPGTGKTYHTVIYAVAIIEGKAIEDVYEESKNNYEVVKARYNAYLENKEIAFTTFHQSYGYEEFIEGIKPQMDSDEAASDGDVSYVIEKGVFHAFCDQARTKSKAQADYGFNSSPVVWKVSLGGTGKNPDREECMLNNHIRIGFDEHGAEITDETDFSKVGGKAVLNAFMNKMRVGDIIFSCFSASTIDAIGVVTGDYEWHDEYEHLKRVRNVKWLVKDLDYNIVDINNGSAMTLSTVYKLNISLSDVLNVLSEVTEDNSVVTEDSDKRFVFIIDEINRGNISKVFGELITLIEPSKRIGQAEETMLTLPYSKKPFGVPSNVYIIGTMNTADRSIALMDTALRRRFHFIEMLPDSRLLEDIEDIDGIDISQMLRMMNKRIELLIDREHTIGHSYFMRLKDTPTLGCLSEIFKNNIIPLLQEYFFDDYEKIRLILGDNQKQDIETQFITKQVYDPSEYFGDAEGVDDLASYIIHEDIFDKNPEAYIGIYK